MSEQHLNQSSEPFQVQHKAELQETASVRYIPLGSPALRGLLPEGSFPTRDDAVQSAQTVNDALILRERVDKLGVDSLTGLPTRTIFDEQLPRFFERAMHDIETGRSTRTAVLIIDLDNLKSANDLDQSHAIGDKYLKAFATIFKNISRPGDFKARIGGDEFIEIIEGVDPAVLERIVNEMQEKIDEFLREAGMPKEVAVGASIGYSMFEEGDTEELALKRADTMMYDKKTKKKSDKELAEMGALDETINPNNFGSNFTEWIEAGDSSINFQALSKELVTGFKQLKEISPGIYGRMQFLSKQIIELQYDLYGEDEQKRKSAINSRIQLASERAKLSAYACKVLADKGHDLVKLTI
jgi:diguanylate cyclase (GGDEF)-like protein